MATPWHRPELVEQRFWAKVNKNTEDGCWEWAGSLSPKGYGRFFLRAGRASKQAHRFAYELVVGPIPGDKCIDHLCRNPSCVNPSHLEVVTPRENTLRGTGLAARNAKKTHCPRGHEYTPENTRRWVGSNGIAHRDCRECWKAR
jgi:hypothetical protein